MNKSKNLVRQEARNEKALKKFQIIAPLLEENLDKAAAFNLRLKLAEEHGLSERTLRRYVNAYQKNGFEGLKPIERIHYRKESMPDNYEELLLEAIQLRREVPRRSIEQIILILEAEGRVAPGVLKRPTLQRHMYQAGFGAEHMEIYKDARQSSSRRFCKPHRMMLVQGDIKYGPYLPIGEGGKMVQTYLSSAIDDHSRLILDSQFYDNQEESVVENTFHQAILKYGRFDKCYFDNGSQYVAKQLKLSLARLSIRIAHAPVKSGKSKGKIEKFHQVVDGFLAEAKAARITTLEELNRRWKIYLDAYYHNRPHDGIREYYNSLGIELPGEGISPLQEWNRDTRPLVFMDATVVGEAFQHHESRRVDKGACISFQGRKYETKTELIGHTVEIAYDPANPEIITVSSTGVKAFQAKPLTISAYCNPKQPVPPSIKELEPETSRFLDALEKNYNETAQRRADAISFGGYRKEVSEHV
jgi:transposase InsO family protein